MVIEVYLRIQRHCQIIGDMKFVIFLLIWIAPFLAYGQSTGNTESSDLNIESINDAVFQQIDDIFDVGYLTGGLPYIIVTGGHEVSPFIIVIKKDNIYIVYSGSIAWSGNYLSRCESEDNDILNWAFNEMTIECVKSDKLRKNIYSPVVTSLLYINEFNQIIFSYDSDKYFKCKECEDNIKSLLSFLFCNYIYRLDILD